MKKYKTIPVPSKISMFSYVADLFGCGYIRVIYPAILASQYRKKNVTFESYYNSYFINDLEFYKPYTFVQFQRAATQNHLELMKHFSSKIKMHTKTLLYYEIDDLLMGINEWNFASDYYKKLEPYIKECMRISDGMIVSTEKLKKIYSKYNNNIKIIPNHLPKCIWGDIPKKEKEKKKIRILYAGSENHFATQELKKKGINGGDFDKKLIDFIKKTTNKYEWVFLGGIPLELQDYKDKIEHHKFCNIYEFPFKLKSLNVDIGIAPLYPCEFNQAKSNIKLLEYTAIGIPAICQDIDPYKKAVIKESNIDAFIYKIEDLASNLNKRNKIWKQQYINVKSQLYWEDNNNIEKYINTYLNLAKFELP